MITPKFAIVKPSFHSELKKRVAEYFEKTGKSSTGNFALLAKAGLLVLAYISIYVHLVFFTPSVAWALAECVLLGLAAAGIGFNVMHDGGHGSFSDNPRLNKAAAVTLGFLGGSHFMWNVKHNIIHHAYTNIDGIDDDIDAGILLRLARTQKKLKIHRYQHLYFWMLYSILYIFWIFVSDFSKYFRKKIGDMPLKKMELKDHFYFWFYKTVAISTMLVIPIFMVGFVPAIIGFLTMTLCTGLVISLVFQLAHTVEHTHFPVPAEDNGHLEDEWAIHQLKTTANFATKNKIISWLVGGLNFQVEHHLFPKISHIHYPAISKIIKNACREYGIEYLEYPRMYQALISHIRFLKEMGRLA
jgi:linoleoyl-CoA desaturase